MELASMIGGWGAMIVLALIALMPRKGTIENTRLDQLQEDLAAERKKRMELETRLDGMDANYAESQQREQKLQQTVFAWMRYYAMIQLGIVAGSVPPLPDLPEELRSDL